MSTGIACPVATIAITALVTHMILIVYSLHVILHLLAVAGGICNRHDWQCKRTTQWRHHQGKGDKNQD
jgi:hypothetical protein